MALDRELAVYRRNLKEWSSRSGQFVLIRGEDICGFYTSYDDALQAGYEKFGLESFFVKQINIVEQADCITRFIEPCHSSLLK